jgi:hypothetical protein
MAESATSVGSLTFFGLFAMFSLSPRVTFYASVKVLRDAPRKLETGVSPCVVRKAPFVGRLVRYIRKHPIG